MSSPRLAHPEATCQRCGGPNLVWWAPSPLWNKVMRGGSINGCEVYGVVCPTCFAAMAEQHGIASGWRLDALDVHVELEMTTPSGRTWDAETERWSEPKAAGPSEGEAPKKEVPVDWRVRSQGLEEALEWIRHQCGVTPADEAVRAMNDAYEAADKALLSLGLPDEEGEGHDSGYEARSAHPGDCVPSPDVTANDEEDPMTETLRRADALLLRFAEMDEFNVDGTYWEDEIAAVRASLASAAGVDVDALREEVRSLTVEYRAAARLLKRRTAELDALREWCRSEGHLPDDLPFPTSFDRILRRRLRESGLTAAGPVAEAPEGAEAIDQDTAPGRSGEGDG